jgi:hypothetical protein
MGMNRLATQREEDAMREQGSDEDGLSDSALCIRKGKVCESILG